MSGKKDLCFGCHKKTLERLEENPPYYKCPDCGYEALFPRSEVLDEIAVSTGSEAKHDN